VSLHSHFRPAAMAGCLLLLFAVSAAQAEDIDEVSSRVTRLEAEIAELKAMVGRLEALLQARPSIAPGDASGGDRPGGSGDLGSRVGALEIQIGALTAQIERIGGQARAPEAAAEDGPLPLTPRGSDGADSQGAPQAPESARGSGWDILDVFKEDEPQEGAVPNAPRPVYPQSADESDTSKPRWYGPRPGDDDGAPQSITPPALSTGTVPDTLPQSLAALPDQNAQSLYEQGYGAFLQREYGEAEKSFSKLVAEYPDDPLAGSAQYWAGESQYMRKQYKQAADTFLAGYRKYSGSDKAPDTLLRLGMSLAALGQKDAACSTFKEFDDKFPNAPAHIQSQAKGEAGKAGC
jgi:tol-pal system protein YbgF